ncbi:assimilatory sulfite reductase (NADPH) flavoprotein subunit [Domibacillus sp. A3M-37]|uniref:assimilatory sulfite reductase (NADPH) flavoprotein subunit n=1 Tax=Domibacillus sp. A3M-37 TaxID=2962037 RepID=UPI0020B8B47A|nr:assimilatory sulfite reductase (NADPH) flavoprotein subunit [Domibacillus sp. A3M-37]MCP3760896.1 assimilatory sulfite reductase (NADPH) flavoprotein subunit [Domibacillus sp. A3M-37]
MQFQVTNSPFNEEQAELLNRLLPTLTESQKVWLGGYLAASPSAAVSAVPAAPAATETASADVQAPQAPVVSKDVTILYGSQTGNAQRLSQKAGKTLESNGFNVTVSAMSDFKPNNLKKVQNLLIVVSTHGEGDPPDNAITFHEFLHGKRAPKLDDTRFSVLSLGDSSYEFFCQTGKEFDQRLEELGGERIAPRVDCDLDFDEPAAEWLDNVVNGLSAASGTGTSSSASAASEATAVESEYSRTNPFHAEVLESMNLNGRGSNKETRHLEISLEGSGLIYKPGDSLGIYPQNDPLLVDELIQALGWNADETITINKQGDVRSLRDAFLSHYEITVLTKPLLEKIAQLTGVDELHDLIGSSEQVKAYINGRDLLDVVQQFGPFGVSPQAFADVLRKMPARLYSIASSLEANPDEVHVTIGAVRYNANGRDRNGVCSILCAERLEPGDTLPVYIQHNDNFKLPENPETPVIMIGPGTGVAPFRSFMQEREESGAAGPTWMFFGDQHFVTDFLYQTEWQKWLKDGVLTKMDVAFSRDTAQKVYVQHRMQESSKELFQWLQEGAAVYVCGDEKNMAHDVHHTLIDIIEKAGSMSREQAEQYVADMQQQKRYQRDVY